MSRRPRIAVTSSRRRGTLMWWFNRLSLWRAGARAVRLVPGDGRIGLDGIDGVVLGGGDDIHAELYGAELRPRVRIDPERDELELNVLKAALAAGLPALGICRGAQMINVFLGGTLHADIHEIYLTAPRMQTALPRKTVTLEADSRLKRIIGRARDRVNALHHQSIDRLGRGLRVVARDEHGIIQAIERETEPFLVGVQWHPEFMVFDSGQQRLFRALVAAAAGMPAVGAEGAPQGLTDTAGGSGS
ncbi:MAG: gamma-glutamyl-gamma-aminobutyrate hydrolase family protein [Rhodospirillales bacterium]|nr:MAG: gamma-glutamyl-gamma-aminobutyrate hydrolase family protein [Rhodospirillales bacterium]